MPLMFRSSTNILMSDSQTILFACVFVCMLVVYCLFDLKMMKGATDKQRLEWMLPLEQDFAWLPHAERTLEGKN